MTCNICNGTGKIKQKIEPDFDKDKMQKEADEKHEVFSEGLFGFINTTIKEIKCPNCDGTGLV